MLFKTILFLTILIPSIYCKLVPNDCNDCSLGEISTDEDTDIDDYDANFMLFTRENPEQFNLLQLTNIASFNRTYFDHTKILKIIIHGWRKTYDCKMGNTLKEALLKRYDANVILVDWSSQSRKNYVLSRLAVTEIGKVVARLVDTLVEFGTPLSSIHIIGHSLGAHVAGIAGLNVQSGKVSRITGLDPAGPLFSEKESNRLRPDSAEFVDVIHTCGHALGFFGPLGQVDFYPNKGTYQQPGCAYDIAGRCSHGRSYQYYAESITSDKFLSVQCPDWEAFTEAECNQSPIPMGEDVPRTARGNYYLKTNKHPPYALGEVY